MKFSTRLRGLVCVGSCSLYTKKRIDKGGGQEDATVKDTIPVTTEPQAGRAPRGATAQIAQDIAARCPRSIGGAAIHHAR